MKDTFALKISLEIIGPLYIETMVAFEQIVEDERTGDISSQNLGFCSATWGHFSKFNNSKVVGDIKKLFTSHKNLGKLLTSGVGFKWLSWLCSKWQHFEKKRAKNRLSALPN